MAPQRSRQGVAVAVAAGTLAVVTLQPAFVPPARRTPAWAAPAGALAAASAASAPALADPIGDAARTLADGAYPFMQEVDWKSYAYLIKPGAAGDAAAWSKAVDKAIVMGSQMDPKSLQDGVMAHHKAIGGVSEANPVLSKGDFEAICASIGRMIASVPESSTMDVYNAFSQLVDSKVPPYLMSTVNEADARKAYDALMVFKDVVKANPITPTVSETPAAILNKLTKIDAASNMLSAAAYPFVKKVDWASDLYLTPLPGVSPTQMLKAIDSALVMGAKMDGKLLKEAAEAHHKALQSVDAKLVTSEADFKAVNAALAKLFASVSQSDVMSVYNSFGKVVSPIVENNLFRITGMNDAQKAYMGLMGLKDVVKAAQPI